MIMAGLLHGATPRRYKYQPRFYTPVEMDEDEGKRIHFRRPQTRFRPKKKSVAIYLVLLLIIGFMLSHLAQVEQRDRPIQLDQIRIEIDDAPEF